ncbi:MAG: hypothetical protein VX871_10900 [Pseudomonadota bacterium]|nr:hypothetical protein [Pseudomonadota bacterium]
MRILVLILIALLHGFAAFWLFVVSVIMRGYGGPGLGWLLMAAAGVGVVIGAVGLVMRRAWGYWIGTAVNVGMIAVAGFMAYSALNSAAAHVPKGVWIAALAVAAQAFLMLPATHAMFRRRTG